MSNDNEHEHQEGEFIKLDGSMGVGDNALFTVITKDDVHGDREETYQFPYALINFNTLEKFMGLKFIQGYKVLRQDKLKEEGS